MAPGTANPAGAPVPAEPLGAAVVGGVVDTVVTAAPPPPPPSGIRFRYSDVSDATTSNLRAAAYEPRAHETLASDLARFAYVELKSLSVVVYQLTAWGASTSTGGTATFPLKVGIVPRAITLAGANDDATRKIAAMMPWMEPGIMNTTVGTAARYTWGEGGVPFPPGIQTDLRAVEIRFGYPKLVVLNLNPAADDKKQPLFMLGVDFVCECSGAGFGRS